MPFHARFDSRRVCRPAAQAKVRASFGCSERLSACSLLSFDLLIVHVVYYLPLCAFLPHRLCFICLEIRL